MKNVAREESLALQNLFPYKSQVSYSIKNKYCQKISFFNDGDLKLGHFDIFATLFTFPTYAFFIRHVAALRDSLSQTKGWFSLATES